MGENTTNTTASVGTPAPVPGYTRDKMLTDAAAFIVGLGLVVVTLYQLFKYLLRSEMAERDRAVAQKEEQQEGVNDSVQKDLAAMARAIKDEADARIDAVKHERTNRAQSEAVLSTRIDTLEKKTEGHTTRIVQIETNYANIKDSLKEIKDGMKDLTKAVIKSGKDIE